MQVLNFTFVVSSACMWAGNILAVFQLLNEKRGPYQQFHVLVSVVLAHLLQ